MIQTSNPEIDLSISLISHNSKNDLEILLPSLEIALKGISYEILLVDNISKDDTVEFIKSNYPNINLRVNSSRQGYGANHNQNLSIARGRYILLMNADIIVKPGCLTTLMNFMDEDDEIGIAVPNVLNEDGSLQYLNKRYPTVLDLFMRRFFPRPLKQLFNKRMEYYEMRDIGYDSVTQVPFISGAFMFTKTDLIKEIKGFDEKFFMYFEDVDLCRRVQITHKTVYCPYAKVIHRWDRAAHKSLKWATVFSLSAFSYFNKWGYQLI